ncbi:MAG: DeoR/GlpR family DNA-binding transcription regulator [Propionibacteriaceae bacterium]|jgi:DeoR/GlpR family transcriptional regulator of sugar metabolism|nr:DeoR/GlpR family DNA-binding transcription regulator [Propionibacteriaceae bacterium]
MMTVQSRRERIERIAASEGEVSFEDLATEFGVSLMTIRRDVEHLQAKGVIRKVLGGVIAVKGTSVEPPFASRAAEHSNGKQLIAEATVELLESGETVLIDSGATALAVAREIKGKGLALTVLTPSLPVAIELVDEPGTTVIVTGGVVRPGELSLIGTQPEAVFSQYNCDTYIMGVAGIDAERGATDYHLLEAAVKRAAIHCSERVVCVAGAEKLDQVRLANVAALQDIAVIVTDGVGDNATLQAASSSGVRVICVGPDEAESSAPSDPRTPDI